MSQKVDHWMMILGTLEVLFDLFLILLMACIVYTTIMVRQIDIKVDKLDVQYNELLDTFTEAEEMK